jgi:hypothetical protein
MRFSTWRIKQPAFGGSYIKNFIQRFLLNNQADALIIQIYSVIKLYMFRESSLPIIRSFLLYIRSSILTLLGSGHQKPA